MTRITIERKMCLSEEREYFDGFMYILLIEQNPSCLERLHNSTRNSRLNSQTYLANKKEKKRNHVECCW